MDNFTFEGAVKWAAENVASTEYREAFAQWADDRHAGEFESWDDAYDVFESSYRGVYSAERGFRGQLWATGYVEELLSAGAFDVSEALAPYVDVLALAQDMELGGDVSTLEAGWGEVFVFSEV